MKIGDILYRYVDGWFTEGYGLSDPHLEEWRCIKETPKGGWVNHVRWPDIKDHFVRNKGKKRFVYQTEGMAWESYMQRKIKRVEHLERQMKETQMLLDRAMELDMTRNDQ